MGSVDTAWHCVRSTRARRMSTLRQLGRRLSVCFVLNLRTHWTAKTKLSGFIFFLNQPNCRKTEKISLYNIICIFSLLAALAFDRYSIRWKDSSEVLAERLSMRGELPGAEPPCRPDCTETPAPRSQRRALSGIQALHVQQPPVKEIH